MEIQGHEHQLRAEATGFGKGNCEPRVGNTGSSLDAKGGRQLGKDFDKAHPGLIICMASIHAHDPPRPLCGENSHHCLSHHI